MSPGKLLQEQNILSCFCHQIKVPNSGALTLSRASEERGANLSRLGLHLCSECDSGGSCLVLAQVGGAGLWSCPLMLQFLGEYEILGWSREHWQALSQALWGTVAGISQNRRQGDISSYSSSIWATWVHLLLLTREAQRWERIFTLFCRSWKCICSLNENDFMD